MRSSPASLLIDRHMERTRLAISQGDSNGIGPEVILGALADARIFRYVEPLIVGSLAVLETHAGRLKVATPRLQAVKSARETVSEGVCAVLEAGSSPHAAVNFGKITKASGKLAMEALEAASDTVRNGDADALVTAPISKEAISLAGYDNVGHTEFLARRLASGSVVMMLVAENMRIGLVSVHVPVREVSGIVTGKAVAKHIRAMGASLSRDYGIARPKIAVLGLNPHAGDGGVIGREEQDIIAPAIEQCCKEGHLAFGPFSADGFFGAGSYKQYDAVLAMYHDQGLIPFKTLAFGRGVNHTAGLAIVRTSPDHGTAFDIAGQGIASAASMRSAIYLARDIVRRRLAISGA